jgi:hypothetical protein
VSGQLSGTAEGIVETMARRKLPIRVFTCTDDLTAAFKLHEGDFSPDVLKLKLKTEARARAAAKKAKGAGRTIKGAKMLK